MKIRLIDRPAYFPLIDYEKAIEKILAKLKKLDGILAVYQLGSIGQPGISDIDLLAVFEDSAFYKYDLRAYLDQKERYFISHGLYGLSSAQSEEAKKYGFYFSFKLLWGNDLLGKAKTSLSVDDLEILKTQIALEFLVKMYINMTIEKTYRIVKIRALLLQIKALLLDLDLLDAGAILLRELLETVISWRERWFETPPTKTEMRIWLESFYIEFPDFLSELFKKHSLYLQNKNRFKIYKNIEIINSHTLSSLHQGSTFPCLSFMGRKYFNLQHRFNDFKISLPYQETALPPIITAYQNYLSENKKWLADHLPSFMALASSLQPSDSN